ncbi:MAG: HAMP domain-containing sensor histidine kinase, partial [Bacteroidota bacterium]
IGRLKERNVQLSVEENLPTIYGDENRMIQVFENLIDNAVKYMGDQQNPTVTIASLESKGYNHFVVKDNGSGMDENALKKLFAPFERFHNTIEGTGLGLYMIKQIVESHDGSITATSEGIDKGATFTVLLPKVLENG